MVLPTLWADVPAPDPTSGPGWLGVLASAGTCLCCVLVAVAGLALAMATRPRERREDDPPVGD
jgi:hypothetical protein